MPIEIATTGIDVDDALRAAAVNSSYSTSRALSKWLKRGVRLHTEGFVRQPLSEFSHAAGPPDTPVAAIHMMLQGDVQGDVLLVMPEEVGFTLVDMLIDAPPGTTTQFTEFEQSCLQETGNIVGTSFANALSQWLNLTVIPAPPEFAHDLACAVIDPLLVQEAAVSDEAWMAKTDFELDSQKLDWSMMLLLSGDSLNLIRSCCDRDEVRHNALHAVAVNAAFQASRSMSKWLKKGVRLTTEGFTRIPLRETCRQFTNDVPVVLLHMELTKQFQGHMLLVLEQRTAVELASRLMSTELPEGNEMDEMARSCLCETANIISTSFANTLAKWLEIETQPAPPELKIDFAQAALDSVLSEQAAVSDDALMSKATFRVDGEWLECALYVVPTPSSFRLIEAFCS